MRYLIKLLTVAVIYLALNAAHPAFAGSSVLAVNITGEINDSQVVLLQKVFAAAKAKNAAAVLVEIDTFGGRVDSAVKIRDLVIDAPWETICYVKNRAWSAGALIAIAHQKIAIAPGGSIGAAEPIPATEKTIAALRAEFSATANKRGRNVLVAEAMVDKTLGLPGYAEPGKIVALTDFQAAKVGYADIVAKDRQEVLQHFGLVDNEVIEYSQTWRESVIGWLASPAVKSMLVSIVFLAIMTEIKMAGVGIASVIGLVAAMLLFGGNWITGMSNWMELALFIGGVLLIITEIFVPGFGFFGIAGLAAILISIFLALGASAVAVKIMVGSLVVAIICFLLIMKKLPSSKLWSKLILKDAETAETGFTSGKDFSAFLGKQGRTVTQLRPAGSILLDGERLDVISEGQFIESGKNVKVVDISGSRIVVRLVEN